MQSDYDKASPEVKKEENHQNDSGSAGQLDSTLQDAIDVSSAEEDPSLGAEEDPSLGEEDLSKQLVIYDPVANSSREIVPAPEPLNSRPLPRRRASQPTIGLPAVGAFTVQCASCFQWRLIPSKEIYEQIREHILEKPFYCETAREWRPELSCDDPGDIQQDNTRLWAIDRPNIAKPPDGWQRLLRIRGEGSTKFADVYYVAPSGKRLRSMVEIQKYLSDNPNLTEKGISLSQFTFQTPRPLQENYIRKRVTRSSTPLDDGLSRSLDPREVHPIAWRRLDDSDVQFPTEDVPNSYGDVPPPDSVGPVKKRIKIVSRQPPTQ